MRRHLGVTIGYESGTGETATVGITGSGRCTGTRRDVKSRRISDLGKTPEPGRLGDFDSRPPFPFPLVSREVPHRRRTTLASSGERRPWCRR